MNNYNEKEKSLLEAVWQHREEVLYPELFGKCDSGICPLSGELFTEVFQQSWDPRWLHCGVMAFRPNSTRESWLYVSSGLSNPLEVEPHQIQKEEYSWLGCEFIMETYDRLMWPILHLHRLMAFQILLGHGRYGDKPMLDYGDRVPLRSSIDPNMESKIRNFIITKPARIPHEFQLQSGIVRIMQCVGATDTEIAFAKTQGSELLVEALNKAGHYPVVDPRRASII